MAVRNLLSGSELIRTVDWLRAHIADSQEKPIDTLANMLTEELGFIVSPSNVSSALANAGIERKTNEQAKADSDRRALQADIEELRKVHIELRGQVGVMAAAIAFLDPGNTEMREIALLYRPKTLDLTSAQQVG